MEPVVIACGGCGAAIRIRHPEVAGRRSCPKCGTALLLGPVLLQSLGCGEPAGATRGAVPEPASASHLTRRLRSLELVLPTLAAVLTSALLVAAWERGGRESPPIDAPRRE